MEKSAVVDLHQIAGAKPGIAFSEDVAQDFFLGLRAVGIALKAAAGFVRRADPPDRFARLADSASDAEAVVAAKRGRGFCVSSNDRGGKAMRQQWRDPAD